jgi:hypothetical protein
MGKTISLYFLPGTGPIIRIFFYWDDNSKKRPRFVRTGSIEVAFGSRI